MASAKRPSRFSPRTSSSLTSQPDKTSLQKNIPSIPRPDAISNGWVEPPVRPPVPSFMDHKGLERQGVLEQMVPLGTHPTAKIKARSKGEPIRRTVHARNLEDMVVDDARATPEIITASTLPSTRASSAGGRGASRRGATFDSATMQLDTPSYALFPPPVSAQSPSTPSHQDTSPQRQPSAFMSPTLSKDPFERALSQATLRAIQNARPDVEQGLMDIRVAAIHDPQLATLIEFAVTNDSLGERGSAVNRKLKKLKQKIRSQNTSPQSQRGSLSDGPVFLSRVSSSPSQSHSRTIGQDNNIDDQPSPNFTSSTSPVLQRPTPLKLSLIPRRSSAVNGVAHEHTAPTRKMKKASIPPMSRRSSSSSLSSVDEGLAAGPPPSSDLNQPNLERNSTHAASPMDEDDDEIEARKEILTRNFPVVLAMESNERPAMPPNPLPATANDSSRPTTKLKLRGPAEALRNGVDQGNHASPTPDPSDVGSAALKRKATTPTPALTPTNLGRPPKKLKTAPKIKMSPQKNKQPAVIAGIARPQNRRHTSVGFEDHHSEQSENNDYCFTCSGTGYLLCCDGCDRAFHFTCLDPPLDEKATLDGPWLCHACKGERGHEQGAWNGLFAQLHNRIVTKNPTSFILPQYVREYYEDVQTGAHGEYISVIVQKANPIKGRIGYDDQPNFQRLKDDKGKFILCCHCHTSSLGQRDIITCDRCSNHWHLDCLNPPLANPPSRGQNGKSRPEWICPLHITHDLSHLDPLEKEGVRNDAMGTTHKVRRPKNAKIVVPALRRGFVNNGLIEITDDSSADEQDEEETPDGVVFKLPASGVKLDFIDRVKSKRQSDVQATYARAANVQLRNAVLTYRNSKRLSQDLSQRTIREQIAALNLAQFATNTTQVDVGPTEADNFLYTVLAETPPDVLDILDRADHANNETLPSLPATTTNPAAITPMKPLDERQKRLARTLIDLLQARLAEDAEVRNWGGQGW